MPPPVLLLEALNISDRFGTCWPPPAAATAGEKNKMQTRITPSISSWVVYRYYTVKNPMEYCPTKIKMFHKSLAIPNASRFWAFISPTSFSTLRPREPRLDFWICSMRRSIGAKLTLNTKIFSFSFTFSRISCNLAHLPLASTSSLEGKWSELSEAWRLASKQAGWLQTARSKCKTLSTCWRRFCGALGQGPRWWS